jgi:hypothetical protein
MCEIGTLPETKYLMIEVSMAVCHNSKRPANSQPGGSNPKEIFSPSVWSHISCSSYSGLKKVCFVSGKCRFQWFSDIFDRRLFEWRDPSIFLLVISSLC